MIEKIKSFITKRQINSDNSSGTTIESVIEEMKLPKDDIFVALKQLHSDKYIVFKKGINGSLIFLKNHTKKR